MEKMTLDKIIVSNPYLRTETDIDSLKKSIQTIGLINPLTINAENELIAGGRRYQALKELGITEAAINRVDISTLEQELISIDENLVRTPLNKLELEKCLNRGREIYEELNPDANKIEVEVKKLTAAEKKIEKEEEENDTTSFAAITAEKTGLSKSVIKNAIRRDEQSSDILKEARGNGDVSASQVNEIIRLNKKEQDKILPYIKEKSVKDVRKLVEKALDQGVDLAIHDSLEIQELPREFKQLEAMVKKCNRIFAKILIENLHVEGDGFDKVVSEVELVQEQSSKFIDLFSTNPTYLQTDSEDYQEDSLH